MANYFVDSTTGNDGDSGLTMDLAWATIEHAFTAGNLVAGDTVWVRRIHDETIGSGALDFDGAYDGRSDNPVRLVGWPRTSASITSATWTSGSTTVDNILGLTLNRGKYLSRYITAPNGTIYLITKIVDSNTLLIDRGYVGATVSGASGAATIHADNLYSEAQAIDDSGWTITKASYNADADDLPTLTLDTYMRTLADWTSVYHLDIVGGSIYWIYTSGFYNYWEGCIVEGQSGSSVCRSNAYTTLKRCVVDGTYANMFIYTSSLTVIDCAFYGATGAFINQCTGPWYIMNANFGVEEVTAANFFVNTGINGTIMKDIKYGGSGLIISSDIYATCAAHPILPVGIENYQKILGAHFAITPYGTMTKTAVFGGSGDPEKRVDGADYVIELLNSAGDNQQSLSKVTNSLMAGPIFVHEFEVNSESKNYRYYVQTQGPIPANQLWIEAEYINKYVSASQYTIGKVVSTNSTSARSGPDDWSQYIEVTGIQPAAYGISKVRIKCFCTYYHLTNKIYIDPNPEIT